MTSSMSTASVADGLELIESQLSTLGSALLEGDGTAIESASGNLRLAMTAFAAAVGRSPADLDDASLRARLGQAQLVLVNQRENLARRASGVDRALASLLPTNLASSTYAGAPGLAALGTKRFGTRLF